MRLLPFISILFLVAAIGHAPVNAVPDDGLYPILKHSKWGFIDKTGRVVIPAQYESFGELSEGLMAVHDGERWGFIDVTGKVVIDFKFDGLQSITENNPKFSEGLACVEVYGKDGSTRYGYIDKSGEFAIRPKYKHAFDFSDGLALVSTGWKYAYINKSGVIAIKPRSYHVGRFSDGLATMAIKGKGGKDRWGYIDTIGKIVIRPQFDWATEFYEGRAAVEINGKWGFIDKSGKVIVQPVYDKVERFSEGLAAVAVSDHPLKPEDIFASGKWGYVDQSGSVVIPLRFLKATRFSEGLACVNFEEPAIPDLDTSGFIDHTGKIIIRPQFTTCTEFKRGIAEVGFRGGSRLIDKSGKVIWTATYEEMFSPQKKAAGLQRHPSADNSIKRGRQHFP